MISGLCGTASSRPSSVAATPRETMRLSKAEVVLSWALQLGRANLVRYLPGDPHWRLVPKGLRVYGGEKDQAAWEP